MNLSPGLTFAPTTFPGGSLPTCLLVVERRSSKQTAVKDVKFQGDQGPKRRGFKVRREDMKKLLLATRGKVFTLENLNRLVEFSRLSEFRTK